MKLKSFFQAYNVDYAVQDGINDFARLSGYKVSPARQQPIASRRKTSLQPFVVLVGGIVQLIAIKIVKIFC